MELLGLSIALQWLLDSLSPYIIYLGLLFRMQAEVNLILHEKLVVTLH